jgi:hypothetical protein
MKINGVSSKILENIGSGLGTPGTDDDGSSGSESLPNDGTGAIGWLRAIYDKLVGTLNVNGNVEISNDAGNAIPVNGSVVAAVTGTVNVSNQPTDFPSTTTHSDLSNILGALTFGLPAPTATSAKQDSQLQRLSDLLSSMTFVGTQAHTDANDVKTALASIDTDIKNGAQKSLFVSPAGNAASIDTAGNVQVAVTNSQSHADLTAVLGAITATQSSGLQKVDIAQSDINIPIRQSNIEVTQSGSAAAVNADVFPLTDVGNYSHLIVQVKGTWVGQLTVQFSNDAANFVNGIRQDTSGVLSLGNTITTNGVYMIPVQGRYFRLRMTAYTSGSVAGSILEQRSDTSMLHWAAQTGTWTVSATQGTSSAANTWSMGGTGVSTSNSASVAAVNGTTITPSVAEIYWGCQIIIGGTGSLSALIVVLEGTNDGGTTWFTIATYNGTTSSYIVNSTPMPFAAVRTRIQTYTAASGVPTVTTRIVGAL